ncbi:MAG: alpha/beta hydrolase [Burkholderiales bacterium]|nr:alpha/beta hydrolase [Burkholderiales bacterium]
MPFITAASHRLEYALLNPHHTAAPWLVFLHEGLGSVAMWKDFPLKLCAATGCRGLVYSRHGYGKSDPLTAPRRADFMHDEARHALPELLDQLHIANPVLFGHSDGASIALLHAGLTSRPVAALVAMAPHVMVEDISIASIEAASVAWETTDLRERLRPYHDDPDSAFRGWNDIWLHPDFRSWNIEDCLPGIRCPVLAIQGVDDEYGTIDQIDRIARGAVNAEVELLKLADCRHSPHKDQPEAVIAAVQRFIARLP